MTTKTTRTTTIQAPIESVWEFIADPAERANAISVVDRFERSSAASDVVTWHVRLPIPFVSSTIAVETRDLERDPPRYVRFRGRSKVFTVEGEHELESAEDGTTRLISRFTVDGKVPGVETFFRRNLDDELDNLERALDAHIGR